MENVSLESLLEIIKEQSKKSDVRQYTCVNDFGFSQFERDLAEAILNHISE